MARCTTCAQGKKKNAGPTLLVRRCRGSCANGTAATRHTARKRVPHKRTAKKKGERLTCPPLLQSSPERTRAESGARRPERFALRRLAERSCGGILDAVEP